MNIGVVESISTQGRAGRPTRTGAAWGRSRLLRMVMMGVLLLGASGGALADEAPEPGGPGAVFSSVEAAVADARAHARATHGPGTLGRFRAGTVYRTQGGFAYTPPTPSRDRVWSMRSPVVRFRLGRTDVASYVVHPASGNNRLDQLNERPNSAERRIVDEFDPLSRPLYLITPTHRIVRYGDRRTTEVEIEGATGPSVSQRDPVRIGEGLEDLPPPGTPG